MGKKSMKKLFFRSSSEDKKRAGSLREKSQSLDELSNYNCNNKSATLPTQHRQKAAYQKSHSLAYDDIAYVNHQRNRNVYNQNKQQNANQW